MKLAFVLVVALAFVPRVHADSSADAERAVVIMEEIATIIDTNKDNCDAMGDKLTTYIDKNGDELKKLKAAGKTLTEDQKKAFSAKYKDRIKAMSEKMRAGLQQCGSNKKVSGAMKNAKSPA